MAKKVFTLAIVTRGDSVLLAKKSLSYGKGYWNGFGGKVEPGETVEQAARRECVEEVGIHPKEMEKVGTLTFEYLDTPLGAKEHEVHIFRVQSFTGQPIATREMEMPTWYEKAEIPYHQMWADDAYWLPLLLEGKRFEGRFTFDDSKKIVDQDMDIF